MVSYLKNSREGGNLCGLHDVESLTVCRGVPRIQLDSLPYYEQTSFVSLGNFIEGALLFAPMGFIMEHLYGEKKRVLLLAAGTALVISLPMGYLQGWIPDRYPDITSVLGALGGAISGVIVCSAGRQRFDAFVKRVTEECHRELRLPIVGQEQILFRKIIK